MGIRFWFSALTNDIHPDQTKLSLPIIYILKRTLYLDKMPFFVSQQKCPEFWVHDWIHLIFKLAMQSWKNGPGVDLIRNLFSIFCNQALTDRGLCWSPGSLKPIKMKVAPQERLPHQTRPQRTKECIENLPRGPVKPKMKGMPEVHIQSQDLQPWWRPRLAFLGKKQ